MSAVTGYVLHFAPDRAAFFERSIETAPSFAEAVSEFDHSRNIPLVCLISTNARQLTHVAHGGRGVRAGTGQRRLNLEEVYPLQEAISFNSIVDEIPRRFLRYVSPAFANGGLLTPKAFDEVVAVLSRLSPELRALLTRYGAERRELIRRLSPTVRASLASQKEAVAGALHIAGLDRAPLLQWTTSVDAQPKSFLEGLSSARLMEDQMIWNDKSRAFPGLEKVKEAVTGIARFEDDEVALEIIVANRTPLESQTGADLIYYNATYPSFVFVQYKAMEHDDLDDEAVFRLPNPQLATELSRMNETIASLKKAEQSAHRHGYRLNENPFFLKLCPRIVFDPDNVGLTPGMYLPLDYWRFIERDEDLVGKRGGKIVTYRNVGRYMTNSDFASVVRSAWVGTTPAQAAILESLIQHVLSEGRAAVIAIKSAKMSSDREQLPEDEVDLS